MKRLWILSGICSVFISSVVLLLNVQAQERQKGRIAFVSKRDGIPEIYVMDADGQNTRKLTHDPWTNGMDPTWSPDGQKIAFSAWRDEHQSYEIYVMDADGKNLRNLTDHPGGDHQPAWSPDGKKIAFFSNRDGNDRRRWDVGNIFVMNADGSNLRRLTENNSQCNHHPTWSPDGGKIAYESRRDGNDGIYVMDADGKNPHNLMNRSAGDYEPAWSPDGERIAFSSFRDGGREIYTVKVDGKSIRRITKGYAHAFEPAWSPDGQEIAFVSSRDGNSEIYVTDANGDNIRRLTDNLWTDYEPAWEPLSVHSVSPMLKQATRWGWLKWISK